VDICHHKTVTVEMFNSDNPMCLSCFFVKPCFVSYMALWPSILCSSWTPRKANHERLTLLKSVHIYKKHRVQYEIRTYFRFMQFLHVTGSTAGTFLEYIQRNLPEGVAMKVTKVEVTAIPPHIRIPNEPQQLALPATSE